MTRLCLAAGTVIVLILVIIGPVWASEAGVAKPDGSNLLQKVVEGQLANLDTTEIQRVIDSLDAEVQAHLPSFDIKRIIFTEGGKVQIDIRGFMSSLARYFLREIILNFRLLGQLLLLVILCATLHQLQVSWDKTHSVDLALTVSFVVMLFISLESFHSAVAIGREAVESMVDFMHAILPMLCALLAAAGAITSATVLHPLLLTAVVLVATLVKTVVFPLCLIGLVLGVAGNLAKGFPGGKLADLANKAAVIILGLLCTIFLGVLTVKGALAPIVDGVGLKTAKFLAGKFIPVVGGVFSGAVEVVAGGSALIKSAVGVFGLIVIIVVAAFPLLKLASILLVYRLVGALVEPISDPRIASALGQIANSLSVVFAAVGVTAVMFFVAITVVISLGNLAAMMQ